MEFAAAPAAVLGREATGVVASGGFEGPPPTAAVVRICLALPIAVACSRFRVSLAAGTSARFAASWEASMVDKPIALEATEVGSADLRAVSIAADDEFTDAATAEVSFAAALSSVILLLGRGAAVGSFCFWGAVGGLCPSTVALLCCGGGDETGPGLLLEELCILVSEALTVLREWRFFVKFVDRGAARDVCGLAAAGTLGINIFVASNAAAVTGFTGAAVPSGIFVWHTFPGAAYFGELVSAAFGTADVSDAGFGPAVEALKAGLPGEILSVRVFMFTVANLVCDFWVRESRETPTAALAAGDRLGDEGLLQSFVADFLALGYIGARCC